jgi:hypothetical protein
MSNYKPKLERCSFVFSQEGNTNGSTDTYEELTILCESPLGIDNDQNCYYILKTETGWSIDNLSELKELFDRIDKTFK